MEPTAAATTMALNIDWQVVGLVALALLAPTLTGFLREFNTKFSETGPWWAKSLISSAIATVMGMLAAYEAQGNLLLGAAGGAILGSFGSVNIMFRKGPSQLSKVLAPNPPPQAEKAPEAPAPPTK